MADKADIYFNYLKDEGYMPRVDDDGDIVFKREGGLYFLKVDEDDPAFFQLVFPAFWKIDSSEEEAKAREVINELNANLKVMKLFLVRSNIWATVEMFIDPIENFTSVFPRSIRLLASGASKFYARMRPEEFS